VRSYYLAKFPASATYSESVIASFQKDGGQSSIVEPSHFAAAELTPAVTKVMLAPPLNLPFDGSTPASVIHSKVARRIRQFPTAKFGA
jgi:hypothetical protein